MNSDKPIPSENDAQRIAEIAPVDRLLRQLLQNTEQDAEQIQTVAETTAERSAAIDPPLDDRELDWYQKHLLARLPARFQIRKLLGCGTFGTVFLAFDARLRREVAIKVLRPEWMSLPVSKQRFIREARATARLNHTNIVRVLEADENDDIVWQVSDVIEGVSLADHLKHNPLPHELTIRFVSQIADALDFAHQRGIVHRDVKPANILINRYLDGDLADADAFLMDFGLARVMDDDLSLSRSGQLLGTPHYLAPELFDAGTGGAGPASDIYSLGVVLLESLIGHLPFENAHGLAELYRLTTQSRSELLVSASSIPRDLSVIVEKAVALQPCDRYLTAGRFADDLRCFSHGMPISARPLKAYEVLLRLARQNPFVTSLLTILMASLLAIAGMAWHSSHESKRRNADLAQVNLTLEQERNYARRLTSLAEKLRDQALTERNSFQQLAWNSRVQEAYHCYESGNWGESLQLLTDLKETHPEQIGQIEWRILDSQLRSKLSKITNLPAKISELRPIRNSKLVVATAESQVFIINLESNKIERTIDTEIAVLHALAVHPKENLLFVGGSANRESDTAQLLSIRWNEPTSPLNLGSFPTTIESIAVSENGEYLICGARYEPPRLIKLDTLHTAELTGSRRNLWLIDFPTLHSFGYQHDARSVVLVNPESPYRRQQFSFQQLLAGKYLLTAASLGSGRLIAVLDSDGEVYVVDLQTASAIARMKASPQVSLLTCSDDGQLLAAGTDGGEVILWRLPNDLINEQRPNDENHLDNPTPESAEAIEIMPSPDLRELLIPDERFRLHSVAITSMAWNSAELMCGTDTGDLMLFKPSLDFTPKSLTDTNNAFAQGIFETAWSRNAEDLVMHDRAGPVYVIPSETWVERISPTKVQDHPSRQNEQYLQEWYLSNSTVADKQISQLRADPQAAMGFAITPDTSQIAWPLNRSDYCIFHRGTGELKRVSNDKNDSQSDLIFGIKDFSPDGLMVATLAEKYQLDVLSTNISGDPIVSFELPGRASCVAWSTNCKQLLAAGNFDSLVRCDLQVGSVEKLTAFHTATTAMRWLGDQNIVLTGHGDGSIRFTNLESGHTERLPVHESPIHSIVCDASERIGLSVDAESNLSVWSIADRRRLGKLWTGRERLNPQVQIISSISFNEDQSQLWMVYNSTHGPAVRCLKLMD